MELNICALAGFKNTLKFIPEQDIISNDIIITKIFYIAHSIVNITKKPIPIHAKL